MKRHLILDFRLLGLMVALLAAAPIAVTADDQLAAVTPAVSVTPPIIAPPDPPAAKPPSAQRMRFVIGLDQKVEYDVFALSNPNRVVVELPDVALRLPDVRAASNAGLIKTFRAGLAAPGRARLVIDVTQPVVVDATSLEKVANGRYRLALEIAPFDTARLKSAKKPGTGKPVTRAASLIQPPSPRPAANPKERQARAFKPVIVLDPGHGGTDTGAMKFGTIEKQVVLAFGHELRRQLEATGRYRVLMTRETDVFVPLDKRVAFGERHDASLFIAIHADYARSSARGATIFTLRDGVARDLARSAKGAAGRRVLTMTELDSVDKSSTDARVVHDILTDLAERDVQSTRDRTGIFARTVIETMGESTPMRQDPDKQAAFRVLKTAQFPSVLIELAYVSNQQDAKNLRSDEWRSRVAESIVSAIENYFSSQVARLPM